MGRERYTNSLLVSELKALGYDLETFKPEYIKVVRKKDINLYNALRKRGLIPKMEYFKITDEMILEAFNKWNKDYVLFKKNDPKLYHEGMRRKIIDIKPGTRPTARKRGYEEEDEEYDNGAKQPFKTRHLEDGSVICGRCLEVRTPTRENPGLCKTCKTVINRYKARGVDCNKWNIKDSFINTIIRDGERKFEIGIRVDTKTESFLRALGYSFIFKEVYEI